MSKIIITPITTRHMMLLLIFTVIFSLLFILFYPSMLHASNGTEISSLVSQSTADTPIKHVIVIIQGKHSFDGYFGTFPGADGIPAGIKMPSNPFSLNKSDYIIPFHIEKVYEYNPEDDPESYLEAYNNGDMNGFVYAQRKNNEITDSARNVMGYYDDRDLPYYWKFASEYVLADKFFSASMRSTLVNGLYAIAADPSDYNEKVPEKGLDINRTIFDELEKINVPWKIYIEGYNELDSWSIKEKNRLLDNIPILGIPRFVVNQSLASHIVDLTDYHSDIQDKNFSSVSYIYFTNSNDNELNKAKKGEESVTNLVYSLMKSHYWNNSAAVVTWNEAGGWYDHVKPPLITNEQNGFRVPALILSAYAKNGYIDNHTYDVTSVLKFIESTFGIAPLADRDNKTNNILHAFDFTKPPTKPIYLDGVANYSPLIKSNDVYGVNMVYFLSFLGPILVTIIWYYKKRLVKNRSISSI